MAVQREAPEGTERLYADGLFFTGPDICEDYGHDVNTGNSFSEMEFRALNPAGRAILKPASGRRPTNGRTTTTRSS